MEVLESLWKFTLNNLFLIIAVIWGIWCSVVGFATILFTLNHFSQNRLLRGKKRHRADSFDDGDLESNFGFPLEEFKNYLIRSQEEVRKDIERMELDSEARTFLERYRRIMETNLREVNTTHRVINAKLLGVYRSLDNFEGIFRDSDLTRARETIRRGETVITEVLLKRALAMAKYRLKESPGSRQIIEMSEKKAAEASYLLGVLAECRFNYFLAAQHYLHAAELQPTNISYLSSASEFAYFLFEYKEAEMLLRTALKVQQQLRGAEHPEVARTLNNLGATCHSQGRFDEAEALYLWALEIYEPTSPNYSDLATLFENYAALLKENNRGGEVGSLRTRVAMIKEGHSALVHPEANQGLGRGTLDLPRTAPASLGERRPWRKVPTPISYIYSNTQETKGLKVRDS